MSTRKEDDGKFKGVADPGISPRTILRRCSLERDYRLAWDNQRLPLVKAAQLSGCVSMNPRRG
jgi:hypothetical protein